MRFLPAGVCGAIVCACGGAPGAWSAPGAGGVAGTVRLPVVTGRAGTQAFAGHPGWVDVCPAGEGSAAAARIGADGRFTLAPPGARGAAIATFDKRELPPLVIPQWPAKDGSLDLLIDAEYVCVPPGYPEVWDRDYRARAKDYWQTFVPRSRHLHGLMTFDGKKVVDWGNKINAGFHHGGVGGRHLDFHGVGDRQSGDLSADHTDHEFPAVAWRMGDVVLQPGKPYALRIGGYKSHGGQELDLDLFLRPDGGDGVASGRAYRDNQATDGDLCMVLIGSRNGQYVENQIRTPEWNILIAKLPPVTRWGQSFVSHGVSLAGVRFWGSNGGAAPVGAKIRVRKGGPEGTVIGVVKAAAAHDSPEEPIVRYADFPGPLPGHEAYYKHPFDLFQAAYVPDEVPLERGATYYIDIEADQPLMMFVDGDYYKKGFAWYDGRKLDRSPHPLQHGDRRFTLAMDIVTYARPGGAPEAEGAADAAFSRPAPDGNLLVNGGAEAGNLYGWLMLEDPEVDPAADAPEPANHGGAHRFGVALKEGGEIRQWQDVPGIEPGQTYEARLWAAHKLGEAASVELLWVDGPYDRNVWQLLGSASKDMAPGWTPVSGRFTPTQDTVAIVVRYRYMGGKTPVGIHVDDVWLGKCSSLK